MDSEFCGESGFCYIPQKNVNVFLLARNEHGWIPKNVSRPAAQISSVLLFSMWLMGPPKTWAKSTHRIWGSCFLAQSIFGFLPSPFQWLWWPQTVSSGSSDHKEWVSTEVRVVPSSSDCDLFLGEKTELRNLFHAFSSSQMSTPFWNLPASLHSLLRVFREMVLFMCLSFSSCFVFYAEFTIVTYGKIDPVGV